MEFSPLDKDGPVLLIPKIWEDPRGYFLETFRQNDFEQKCGNYQFVQDNQSKSRGNVLRGLHYQLNNPQGKLVRVIEGRVFDVAVDLRKSSSNFGKSYGVMLDSVKHHEFWVPPGFAHGFFVMSEVAAFVYKCTSYYEPGDEYCLLWNDPALDIAWPIGDMSPQLSEKDMRGVLLRDCKVYE